VHLSTGNYNPKSARLYTDLGFFSADAELTADAEAVFQHLASLSTLRATQRLLVAPTTLHDRMVGLLGQVEEAARAGRTARVIAKFNSLTDPHLIHALVAAGQAGAQIDLIIRGACLLPPGIPGLTDNIRVRSVVGRFLEHSRIFLFRWGDEADDEALYLSSADWMTRNMTRRIEVAWPILDRSLRRRVIDECLLPYLNDDVDAWQLAADGSYTTVPTERSNSAQRGLIDPL
jgi:polyphosphate kinase